MTLLKRLWYWLMHGRTWEQEVKEIVSKAIETIKPPKEVDRYRIRVKKGKLKYTLEFIEYEDGTIKRNNLGRYKKQ